MFQKILLRNLSETGKNFTVHVKFLDKEYKAYSSKKHTNKRESTAYDRLLHKIEKDYPNVTSAINKASDPVKKLTLINNILEKNDLVDLDSKKLMKVSEITKIGKPRFESIKNKDGTYSTTASMSLPLIGEVVCEPSIDKEKPQTFEGVAKDLIHKIKEQSSIAINQGVKKSQNK